MAKGAILRDGHSQTWMIIRLSERLTENTGSELPASLLCPGLGLCISRAHLLVLRTQQFALCNTVCLNNTERPGCRNEAFEET